MKNHFKNTLFILIHLLFSVLAVRAEVKLPRLISEGMVLQRDAEIRVWGWADSGEKVSVEFLGEKYNTTAVDGKWQIMLPAQKFGGPHEMVIKGNNTLIIRDILIGDVWVCSGQSNMEMSMISLRAKFADHIATSENKFIRQFAVPRKYVFNVAQEDVSSGEWKSADPQSVLRFSAVAYYFAKELYERYQIPIGLINATLGGSRAESWMSEDALISFPTLYDEAQKYKDSAYVAQVEAEDRRRIGEWYKKLAATDEGYHDPKGSWHDADYDDSQWDEVTVPGFWTNGKLGAVNGSVWYRRHFDVPAQMAGKAAKLPFGNIIDADSVFINGIFIGNMGTQYISRNYNIPEGLLKAGDNIIAVRIVSPSGKGGFVPEKQYAIVTDDHSIDLSGIWKYQAGSIMDPLAGPTFIMWKATGLYNGMIAPLLPYVIKGVIWYQGESNVGRAEQYQTLFPAQIQNWRSKWNQGDFPFLFVQLPDFGDIKDQPSESGWAMFREAQAMSLSVPNTGMAVTIDVGEWNDIHPINKKDVGKRLALIAENKVYGDKTVIDSGPVFRAMKIKGNKAILSFDNTGSGLMAKEGGKLKHFAIAGADKKFVWAEAEIKGRKVVVWNEQISLPVAVRYAWADAPQGINFYNKEGLPARPFRTDN